MQQLQLQFEGYADNWQPIDVSSATKERKEREVSSQLVRIVRTASVKCSDAASEASALLKGWLSSKNMTVTDLAGATVTNLMVVKGTAITAFCFSMMFLAAVLQGGVA